MAAKRSAFKKGDPKPPNSGRKKGVQNKTTRIAKEALTAALNEAHPDGAKGWFLQLSREEPRSFATLVGLLIPKEVITEVTGQPMVFWHNYAGEAGKNGSTQTEDGEGDDE